MGSSTKTLGGASPSRQMGELYSFIIMFNPISFVSPFSLPFLSFSSFFFFFFFFFPFRPSQCEICLWCCFFFKIKGLWRWALISLIVFPSPSSFYASFLPFSFVMAKPLVSLPSFSHFFEVSSPFLQLAMCSFSGSSKKSEEEEEETPLQEANTGFPYFPSFSFFFPFFFLN